MRDEQESPEQDKKTINFILAPHFTIKYSNYLPYIVTRKYQIFLKDKL